MSQNTVIPAIEDVVWAELLSQERIKLLRRNERVIKRFSANGWISYTSRKDEFTITDSGRAIAQKRLPENWPSWKEDLEICREAGLSAEDPNAWRMLKRRNADHAARPIKEINRRTLNAWERRHSKASSKGISAQFQDVRVTVDEVTRIRVPTGSRLLLKSGKFIDCDLLMESFGEVNVPERGWKNIDLIDAPQSRLIFTIENKGAFVDFPIGNSVTLIFVPGDNTSSVREVMSRLSRQPTIHFGDFDPKGIAIYEALHRDGLVGGHFVPSYIEDFVPTHALDCETPWPDRDYTSFHWCVSKLVSAKRWLEQEALVIDQRFEADVQSQMEAIVGM